MIFVSKLSCFLPSRGRHFGSNIAEKPVQVEDNKSESRIYLRKFCLFVLPFEVGLKFVLADKVLIQVLSLTNGLPPQPLLFVSQSCAVASCSQRCG